MLTLIEPINLSGFQDRPHLGCAMLIAACKLKGIKTTLITGQTRYLKNMFINDSEELWQLIESLKDSDLKEIGISDYKKSIQEKGIKQFQDELKNLYQDVILDKNPRHYFNAQRIEKFANLLSIFNTVYLYYLTKLNHNKLKIIDGYALDIIKSGPSYIGFSLVGNFGPLSRAIRKRIKELTDIPIIVGGSLTPFIDLEKLDETFKEEYLDYLVVGTGDSALPLLIEALEKKNEPKRISNIFYKKDAEVKGNALEAIDDLDSLSYPDYSQFDLDLYLSPKRILPLQTARGCSWKRCAFCSHSSIYMGKYRTFSIEKVIETMEHLQNSYNCSHFVFHDEELPPGRAKKISEAILNNNLKNISIYSYGRLTGGYNSNRLLGHLSKAGFSTIAWGVESGSQKVLNLMDKGTKLSQMGQILKKSSGNGIANLCFVFFGFPGETKIEAQQTIRFLENHADYVEDIMLQSFDLMPNSPIGRNPKEWGVEVEKDGRYSTKIGMNAEEVGAFSRKFNKEFEINSIKVTSDKLKYLMPGTNRRMLHFMNSSHNLLSKTVSLEYLKEGKLNSIFPIILGEVKNKGDRIIFQPININETNFVNQYFPVKEIVLDSLKKKIFILSDGTLSIEDIILTSCKDFTKRARKKRIYKDCVAFFEDIFSKNFGLGFAKSWRI